MIYKHEETELFGIQKSYTLTFVNGDDKIIDISVTTDYQANPDFEEITDITFLTPPKEEKAEKEIEEWIRENPDEWKKY